MNTILGFGIIEEKFELQEFNFIEQFIKEKSKGNKDFIFTNELVSELTEILKNRKEEFDELKEKYKTSSKFPDRYSSYYYDIVNNCSTLCVTFRFSHINRNHALSPDGWALLGTKGVYYADVLDFRK